MKRRGLITFVFLAIIVFAGLAFYGDFPELLDQVSSLPLAFWFMALGLALANYLIRLVRWLYYLKVLGVQVGWGASTAIFVSGLGMAISPGRVGELTKSYFLKEKREVPVAISSAVVITERITDMVSVFLLSLWGLALVPYGWAVAIAILAVFGTFAALLTSPWGSRALGHLPLPRRWRPFLDASRDTFRQLLSVKPLGIALVLGVLAWFAEGFALWLILQGLDTPGSLGEGVSIYAVATMLGALTMLPGGLVGTEASMVALLQRVDLTRTGTQASAATFIIRVCTLWFAVSIGLLAMLFVQVYMPKKAANRANLSSV